MLISALHINKVTSASEIKKTIICISAKNPRDISLIKYALRPKVRETRKLLSKSKKDKCMKD